MQNAFPINKEEFFTRLETVKILETTDFETYSVVKDTENGQHYLRYSFFHINLSEGGRRDEYEHLLPLDSDDVLGVIFGEQPYRFPEHWKTTYYRSGTDNRLMQFDPSENHGLENEAETEKEVVARLEKYMQEWEQTDDKERLTKQFFSGLDDILKKENN